jgi:hypothetical protein
VPPIHIGRPEYRLLMKLLSEAEWMEARWPPVL